MLITVLTHALFALVPFITSKELPNDDVIMMSFEMLLLEENYYLHDVL